MHTTHNRPYIATKYTREAHLCRSHSILHSYESALLMDEWLAAGDAAFLAKARRRMEDFVADTSILVLASHSMPLLQEWCNRAILLDQGRIVAAGGVEEVSALYESGSG